MTPAILDDFKVFLASRRIQPSVAEWSDERRWIDGRLLAEVVTLAHGVAAGDQIAAGSDPQVQAAVRSLHDPNALRAAVTH